MVASSNCNSASPTGTANTFYGVFRGGTFHIHLVLRRKMKNFRFFILLVMLLALPLNYSFSEVPDLKKAEDYKSNINIEVVKKVPLRKGYHEGLFYDGENIWVNNGENINTWVVSTKDGSVVREIKPIGTFTEGITASGDGRYWVTDWNVKKLYRVTIEKDKMLADYEISLDPARPTGVIWTGRELYVMTWTRGMGTKYHLMQLDENEHMFRKMRIKGIPEPSQLAWDGKYLWVTSWYNQRVYKLDVDSFKVLGSFQSPAKQATGIVWDGAYFWITGTYDDLYKVRIIEE